MSSEVPPKKPKVPVCERHGKPSLPVPGMPGHWWCPKCEREIKLIPKRLLKPR